MMVFAYCDFDMEKQHGLILSNILFKNLAKVTSLCLRKEPALKINNVLNMYENASSLPLVFL